MKVLVLHSLPPEAVNGTRTLGEFDVSAAAENVASVLPDAVVAGVAGEVREILGLLERHGPDVVFNICEAPLGRPDREAHVAGILEWLGVRFTGSGSETLALCRRKDRTNAVLGAAGIAVPRSGVFPCIVKPADEDGSAYIREDSVCENEEAVAHALALLPGRAVVQEFLTGREFVVGLWGCRTPEYFSIGETHFRNGLRLITYQAKWEIESHAFTDTPLDYATLEPALQEAVLSTARGAWTAVEARGYARIDIRLDADGVPRVLDVNPNPELGAGVGICRAVQEAGWTWERFVRQQIEWA